MTGTLTERYVHDTIRRLPAATQSEVRRELEGSIADAIDARVGAGASPEAAERDAIEELGDPAVLASDFADRPLHLIGPRYFLVWWRILKMLLWIVTPAAAAGVAIAHAVANSPFGTLIGEVIVVIVGVIVHLFFWVTLTFAVLDRSGARITSRWTVDRLPETPGRIGGTTDAIAGVVVLALIVGALVWDRLRGLAFLEGTWTSTLSDDLWPSWIGGLFVIMLAEAVVVFAVAARGRWTVGLVVGRATVAVLAVGWIAIALGRGSLLSPEVIDALAGVGVGADVLRILAILLGAGVAAAAIGSVAQAWRGVRQATGQSTRRPTIKP